MNRKLFVDVAGYAALVPVFILYNYLERSYSGWIAVLGACIAFLPIGLVWHLLRAKISEG
jgi:hypothetical protein